MMRACGNRDGRGSNVNPSVSDAIGSEETEALPQVEPAPRSTRTDMRGSYLAKQHVIGECGPVAY